LLIINKSSISLRSVPGYETVIALLGVLVNQYAQDNSRIYDLGCSLGAATLSAHQQTRTLALEHICVDNSSAMLKRCESRLKRLMPEADLTMLCEDIEKTEITKASVVIVNFTLQFTKKNLPRLITQWNFSAV